MATETAGRLPAAMEAWRRVDIGRVAIERIRLLLETDSSGGTEAEMRKPSLIKMYSLVGRIRMISSEAVLKSAEKVTEDILESYKRPPTTFQEFQQSWEDSNPWHEFTKACRAERQSMLGRL